MTVTSAEAGRARALLSLSAPLGRQHGRGVWGGGLLAACLLCPACGSEAEIGTLASPAVDTSALLAEPVPAEDADPPSFSARVSVEGAGPGGTGIRVEIASELLEDAEVLVELFALDETQAVSSSVSLGVVGAGETRAFSLAPAVAGLRRATLRMGGALTLIPRLRVEDAPAIVRPGGALVVGDHFDDQGLRVYDLATRSSAYAGGRLDGSLSDGQPLSPTLVRPRRAPAIDDGEPDPDHGLAQEAP